MANTINNPGIPYIGPIPGGLQDGLQIHVSGTAEHHHNGFLISLQCGGSIDPRSECAFVFNPRFNENQVVRNSLQGGAWGQEERHGGFPFNRGHHCDVTILVQPDKYSVSVNGHHFCDYNHRIQKHRVTHITVEQGLLVKTIRFEPPYSGGGGFFSPYPGQGAPMGFPTPHGESHGFPSLPGAHHGFPAAPGAPHGFPAPQGAPIYNPPTPFVTNVGGLYPNKMIFISGIPHQNPTRFTVYLQKGSQFEPHEVAMCFDARFVFGNDRNTIVSNHKQGNWGSEQRNAPYFPFTPNAHFDMIILVEHNCFKVAVNNQHLVEFRHRIQPLHSIDTLRIDGDVRLTQIRIQ